MYLLGEEYSFISDPDSAVDVSQHRSWQMRKQGLELHISKADTCDVPTSQCQEDQDLPSMGGAFERSQICVVHQVI